MKKAIFTGTFDPFTNGHLNIVERGLMLFDHIIIAVSHNDHKKTLFDLEERMKLVKQSVSHLKNVTVISHRSGLSVELAKHLEAVALIKGVRNANDMQYEQSMAFYGKHAVPRVETVCLFTDQHLTFISSSGVKEYFKVGGDVSSMVHRSVQDALVSKLAVERVVYEH